MKRVPIPDAHRTIEEADYKGWHIRVVVAYSPLDDDFVMHLYIGFPNQPVVKVYDPPKHETSIEDALDLGFGLAREWIDELKGRTE